jgi:hypothetical protein
VCLVAAKTEGEDMGQYVMALYRQLILHLRRPSHCGRVSFMERKLVRTPRDAGCRVKCGCVRCCAWVPGGERPQLELARAEAQGLPMFTQPR